MASSKHGPKTSLFFILAVAVTIILCTLYYMYRGDSLSKQHSIGPSHSGPYRIVPDAAVTLTAASTLTRDGEDSKLQSFLLVSRYTDQLSNALEWFTRLAAVSVALHRQTLVPFIFESHLYGIPRNEKYMPMSDLYQLSEVERHLKECLVNIPRTFSLLTLKEFVSTTWQRVDLTTLEFHSPGKYVVKEQIVDCEQYKVKMKQEFKNSVKYLNIYATRVSSSLNNHFKVVKRLCIFTVNLSPEALASQVSTDSPLLVYMGMKPQFKLQTTCGGKKKLSECCRTLTWPVSDKVSQTAHTVSEHLGIIKPYAAVHVRIERLVRGNPFSQSLQCVEKLKQQLETLQQPLNQEQTILVHDMGDYGTDSCGMGSNCYQDSVKVLNELKSIGLKLFQYKPDRGEMQNGAFVALVEREVVTEADQLVTMGGGHFQNSVRDHFLLTHNKSNLYHVC